MLKYIYHLIGAAIIVSLLLNGCTQNKDASLVIKRINAPETEAVGSYFTYDNNGNPVLCWTEKDKTDSLYRLSYAVYDTLKNEFSLPIMITSSVGSSTSAESMGKIGFKNDGTVVAVFAKRFLKEKSPFAGAIYYTSSSDKGKNWSTAEYLHSDTSHSYGRGFFDLTTLKNGEIAAIWLDGRYRKSIDGSALFFAKTEKNKGFGRDSCLAKGTCECCRTDIITDKAGNLHIAYRGIIHPPELLGRQVRDMAYRISKNNGATFSTAKIINKDNWIIEGCPHTGPSLAITNRGVNATWFTAGGNSGIYFSKTSGLTSSFMGRNLITSEGKHPQLAALANGTLALVCEESTQKHHEENHKNNEMKMEHSQSNMMMTHAPAGAAKIILRMLKNGNIDKTIAITDGHSADHHAVISSSTDGFLISWVREENNMASIYYTQVKVD